MMPFLDPLRSCALSTMSFAAAVMRGEGHAPVVAVLVASAKADEPIAAPKGRAPRPPRPVFPVNRQLSGVREGGHDGVRGPILPDPALLRGERADAVMVGAGHAPVVAVLLASAKSEADVDPRRAGRAGGSRSSSPLRAGAAARARRRSPRCPPLRARGRRGRARAVRARPDRGSPRSRSAGASPTPRQPRAAAATPSSIGRRPAPMPRGGSSPPGVLLSLDRKSVATSRGAGDFQMVWLRRPLRLLAVAWTGLEPSTGPLDLRRLASTQCAKGALCDRFSRCETVDNEAKAAYLEPTGALFRAELEDWRSSTKEDPPTGRSEQGSPGVAAS